MGRDRGAIIWFTGLSGAGKSTLASAAARQLFALGDRAYVLDGDVLRQGLNSDLGFSAEDRRENVRRISEVARLFANAGFCVLVAAISPYRSDREAARRAHEMKGGLFIEVYVNTPLGICIARDPKGLYARSSKGILFGLTGVDDPYEEPSRPDLTITADRDSSDGLAAQVVELYVRLKQDA